MKKILLASSLCAITLLSVACGSSSNDKKEGSSNEVKQVLKRVENAELPTADLSLATDTVSHTALYNTYEGLYRLGDSNELIPAGATELATVSEDGLKYTLKLNEKSKWSDGKAVTASDYVFSWQRTVYIQYNFKKDDSVLKNENVRKAISYSIDRDSVAANVLANGSNPAETYVPVGLAFSPEGNEDFTKAGKTKAEYDKDKAKESWEKAQKELGKDSIELELLVTDTESAKKLSEYLQEELQETLSGVKINVTSVPFAVSLDRLQSGSYDISLAGWGADYPDPMSFLNNLVSGNPLNYGSYSNENYDTLINEINTKEGSNLEARWEKMVEANQIIMDELPIAPVFQQAKTYLRNATVKGVESHSMGAEFDYKNAEITE